MVVVIVMSSFSFLGTTVFAHPTVAEVEEMSGLMHFPNDANFVLYPFTLCLFPLKTNYFLPQLQSTKCKRPLSVGLLEPTYLRESGESINLTGTLNLFPSRKI